MRKLTVVLMVLFSVPCYAQFWPVAPVQPTTPMPNYLPMPQVAPAYAPQYNPFVGSWEMAPNGSRATYNPHSGTWSMKPEGYQYQYNPFSGKWE